MEYQKLAKTFFDGMVRDVPTLSDYAKTLFHPKNFELFLSLLHRRINGCFQSYSLTVNEVDWDEVYPFLLDYAKTADPIKDRQHPLLTLEDAQTDLLTHLGDYFVHLSISSQHKYNNYLRKQAGTWAYKASMAIAPKYPMERPMCETSVQTRFLGNDERDQATEQYFFSKNPYQNAIERAKKTEEFANNFFANGGWDP